MNIETLDDYLNQLPDNLSDYDSDISDSDSSKLSYSEYRPLKTNFTLDSGDFKDENICFENPTKYIDIEIAKQKDLLQNIENFKATKKLEITAAIKIQFWYRKCKRIQAKIDEQLRIDDQRNICASKIQSWYRHILESRYEEEQFQARLSQFRNKNAAAKIQRFYRKLQISRTIQKENHYKSIVQSCLVRKKAVLNIEQWYQMITLQRKAKNELSERKWAIRVIQNAALVYINKKRRERAVLLIQKFVKIWIFKRNKSARLIQRYWKKHQGIKKQQHLSAIIIQKNYRKYSRCKLENKSAKIIQAGYRGMLARRLVTDLRKKYGHTGARTLDIRVISTTL